MLDHKRHKIYYGLPDPLAWDASVDSNIISNHLQMWLDLMNLKIASFFCLVFFFLPSSWNQSEYVKKLMWSCRLYIAKYHQIKAQRHSSWLLFHFSFSMRTVPTKQNVSLSKVLADYTVCSCEKRKMSSEVLRSLLNADSHGAVLISLIHLMWCAVRWAVQQLADR